VESRLVLFWEHLYFKPHKAGKPISLNGRNIVFLNQEFLVSNQRSADFYLAGIEKSSATTQTVCSLVKIVHTRETHSINFFLQPLF